MICEPNARRDYRPHAPLPALIHPYQFCTHAEPYCTECAPVGTLLLRNQDVERRSWWIGAPRAAA